MSKYLCVPVLAGLLLGLASPSRADDQAEAKAIIDKAIKAMGDEAKLKKYQGATWKGKGKVHVFGDGLDYTGEWAVQGAAKYRFVLDAEVMGMKIHQILVVNGDKGWLNTNGTAMDVSKDLVAEQREQMFSNWNAIFMPTALKDKQFELSTLGESEIEKRKAVGVRAVSKGHRDLNLYFDKETGLPIKGEWRVKDVQGFVGGNEVTQEIFLSDYKEVQGLKIAMKLVAKWDGKPYVDAELSDYKLEEMLDDSLFAQP
jgi:outer membrane lipoprotein-sorting protein